MQALGALCTMEEHGGICRRKIKIVSLIYIYYLKLKLKLNADVTYIYIGVELQIYWNLWRHLQLRLLHILLKGETSFVNSSSSKAIQMLLMIAFESSRRALHICILAVSKFEFSLFYWSKLWIQWALWIWGMVGMVDKSERYDNTDDTITSSSSWS